MKCFAVLAFVWVAVMAAPQNSQLQQFAAGNHKFSANIYKQMAAREKGNFLVCPMSVEVIMALVQTGANGKTATELARGLNLPESKQEVESLMNAVVPSLRGNDKYSLSTANKVYIKEGFTVKPQFLQSARTTFQSEVENINFVQNVAAAKTMNEWVESKTNNLIHDLISSDDLDEMTRLVLINALYFKGKWVIPFDNAYKRDFHISPTQKTEVDMMSQTDVYNYYESPELKAKFLELPYQGNDIVMTIALPNEIGGLAALESRIDEVFAPKPYTKERVFVQIPKFTMESSIQFHEIMKNMGVSTPFGNDADFSGISDVPLKISKIIQKTFINVTEEGTEAAAATAGGIVTLSIPAPPLPPKYYFNVDRPFILYLTHTRIGHLFVGKVTKVKSAPRYNTATRKNFYKNK